MNQRAFILAAFVLSANLLTACGSDPVAPPPADSDVASIVVSPTIDTLEINTSIQLTATVKDAAGNTLTNITVTWSSSDNFIATVNASGLVTGAGIGSATITASTGTKTGQATVVVTGPTPTISSVSPATGTVGTQLTITGTAFRDSLAVLIDTLASDSVDVVSDTLIFAFVPAGVAVDSTVAVTVRNADGTEVTADSAFTAIAPVLAFANSATKPSGRIASTIIIEGDAFGDLQGTGRILFSDGVGGTVEAVIASEDDWTNTFIVTTVPSGTETGDLVVETATGMSNALPFTVTQEATFSPSTITWTVTTDLPVAVSGHAAVFTPIEDAGATANYAHIMGGADNTGAPLAQVLVGQINADGTVSAWPTTTALPEARAFHASVAATPFNSRVTGNGQLYVLGGISTASGQPTATVSRTSLNLDGTVGNWTTTTPLPQPLHSLGAVVFRGAIYVAGGSTTDNVPVATVYRARIDSLGELGSWEALPALPDVRSYHGFFTFGGLLYAIGGDSGQVAPNDADATVATKYDEVVYAKINLRTGDLVDPVWTVNPSSMGKARSKHSALIGGGNAFISAGLYTGAAGSSENIFAQINADGTIGSFGGATGSNTLESEGGANLFNHAAIAYVDASGVAHVMMLGGDDVDNPGTKRAKVLFF